MMFPSKNNGKSGDDLSELRSLLLGVEPTKLSELYERLENAHLTAEDISRILPEAIIMRTMQDRQLVEAMVPTVEQAIQSSVKHDLNVLSNALFPIVGSASRKAIASILGEMIQSWEKTLEHSLSPQSFKWRLEARQTGKSFAEVVLLRTLVYQVEQVFLIHKQTGLLLHHLVAPQAVAQDPDLISAMLTAIQDFVRDSFKIHRDDDGLHSVEFGELTIWLEEGPQAVIAGVVRGNAPYELRSVFREALAKVHLKFNRELKMFAGNTDSFTACKPYIETCLVSQYKLPHKKSYPYISALLGTVAIALGIWVFFAIRQQWRWNTYIEQLKSQPGIVVIETGKRQGKYFVSGMRDPLAVDPKTLITQVPLNPQTVLSQWEPYLSFDPKITTRRSEEILQPPSTVSLEVDEKGILHARGSAPRGWVVEARRLWRFIPGITRFEEKNLSSLELSQLESYKKQIEQEKLLFIEGTTQFASGEEEKLQTIAQQIQKLLDTAKYIDQNVRIKIIGHTSTTGTEERNLILSQDRANKILSYLRTQGIETSNFETEGVASKQPLRPEVTEEDKKINRRISFQIFLSDTNQ